MKKQGNHYKGNNGECYAASCHSLATITIVSTHKHDDEIWEHRADYCDYDAEWFYKKLSSDSDVIDVWDLLAKE